MPQQGLGQSEQEQEEYTEQQADPYDQYQRFQGQLFPLKRPRVPLASAEGQGGRSVNWDAIGNALGAIPGQIGKAAVNLPTQIPLAAAKVPGMLGQMAGDLWTGANIPGKVYTGEAEPTPENALKTADTMFTLGMGMPAPENSMRMFGGMWNETADFAALERAKQMEAQGLSNRDIWYGTGWFKGREGLWKNVIPDRGARINAAMLERDSQGALNVKDLGPTGNPLVMDDLMQTWKVLDAYPWLRKVPIRKMTDAEFEAGGGSLGGGGGGPSALMNAPSATLPYGEMAIGPIHDPVELMKAILHETQHFIQGMEGFARGGGAADFQKAYVRRGQMAAADFNLAVQPIQQAGLDPNGVLAVLQSPMNLFLHPQEALWAAQNVGQAQKLVKSVNKLNALNEIWERAQAKYRRLAGEIEAFNTEKQWELDNYTMFPEDLPGYPNMETHSFWPGSVSKDAQQIIKFEPDRWMGPMPVQGPPVKPKP